MYTGFQWIWACRIRKNLSKLICSSKNFATKFCAYSSFEEHYETDKSIGKQIYTQSIGPYLCSNRAKSFVPMPLSFRYFSTLMINSVVKFQWSLLNSAIERAHSTRLWNWGVVSRLRLPAKTNEISLQNWSPKLKNNEN